MMEDTTIHDSINLYSWHPSYNPMEMEYVHIDERTDNKNIRIILPVVHYFCMFACDVCWLKTMRMSSNALWEKDEVWTILHWWKSQGCPIKSNVSGGPKENWIELNSFDLLCSHSNVPFGRTMLSTEHFLIWMRVFFLCVFIHPLWPNVVNRRRCAYPTELTGFVFNRNRVIQSLNFATKRFIPLQDS